MKRETTSREHTTLSESRLPPGQYEINELRVLHVGNIPEFDPENWTFEVTGLVKNNIVLTWKEFRGLTESERLSDFHCVTGWSKLDNKWSGVQFQEILEMAQPDNNTKYATIICDGEYTTSLTIEELLEDDVLFAYKLDGNELEPRLGGPLRLVVPKKYAYKSAKWVRKIKFTEKQELGYWETRGYSNTADPWKEERYAH